MFHLVHLLSKTKQSQSFLALFIGFPGPSLLLLFFDLLNFQACVSAFFSFLVACFAGHFELRNSMYLGCDFDVLSYKDCLLCPIPSGCVQNNLCYSLYAAELYTVS